MERKAGVENLPTGDSFSEGNINSNVHGCAGATPTWQTLKAVLRVLLVHEQQHHVKTPVMLGVYEVRPPLT
eukprot:scaffold262140_cov18-Tisochrysis_lutea.AAC.1